MNGALSTLTALPFVTDVACDPSGSVRLSTPEGDFVLTVYRVPERAGIASVDRAMTQMREHGVERAILVSPRLSRPIVRKLLAAGCNFADATGNCHLSLDGRYVATIVDPRPMSAGETANADRSTSPGEPRAPGYQVLFALLAREELLAATLRPVAAAAGVSRQPVVDMLEYLAAAGWTEGRRRSRRWTPEGRLRALDLWVRGYASRVRKRMKPRVYRAPHGSSLELQSRLEEVLAQAEPWRWYGDTASDRLLRHGPAPRTSVLASVDLESVLATVPAMRAREGNLVVLRSFAPLCLEGATPETAHPLLVYAELCGSSDPRSNEAARQLLAQGFVE